MSNRAFILCSLLAVSMVVVHLSSGCHGQCLGVMCMEDPGGPTPGSDGGSIPVPDLFGRDLTQADIPPAGCVKRLCQGKQYACGNCIDDDGDGRVDSNDGDCLGPCDNSESGSLDPNIPGLNNAPCKADCFFDQDTGAGNDDCFWDHRCDPHEIAPNYYPETEEGDACKYDKTFKVTPALSCAMAQTKQSDACLNYCGPLTPNGCDCFGCCLIGPQANEATGVGVYLSSQDKNSQYTCTLNPADLADPDRCHPCQIVSGCLKTCGHCQLCVGKDTLPPDCIDGGTCPASLCPGGKPCGGGTGCAPCADNEYCITGCCIALPG